MKCIYWNTKNSTEIDRILDILETENPELLFLSEFDIVQLDSKTKELTEIGFDTFPNPGCERVSIIKKKSFNVNLGLQNRFFTVLKEPTSDLFIIGVHFPSQYHRTMDSLKSFIRDFRHQIDSNIGSSIDKKILIIGDFNVNPFESPMIGFDGFAASNSINSRKSIISEGTKRTTYYNPTWRLYSDLEFPGTKKHLRPSGSAYDIIEHHFLDQVVISSKLLEEIVSNEIKVLKDSKKYQFYKNNNIIGSDHLPLMFKLKLA